MLHAQERAFQVHVDDTLPLLVAAVDHRGPRLDRGGAHERVEAAEALAGRVDHRRDLAFARDVDGHRLDRAAGRGQVVGDLLRTRLVDVGDDDPVAVEREPVDDRFAQSGRATGHDDHARRERWPLRHRNAARPPSHGMTAPGRVRRRVAREEERDRGDLVGGADAAQREMGRQRLEELVGIVELVGDSPEARRVDRAGRDHVGAHRGPVLDGDLARQRDEPGLGGAVRGVALGADQPERRRGVDDRPAARRQEVRAARPGTPRRSR